jgi:hypothetical protein
VSQSPAPLDKLKFQKAQLYSIVSVEKLHNVLLVSFKYIKIYIIQKTFYDEKLIIHQIQ